MWYDRKNMRALFFLGAALAFIGMGAVMRDHPLPGILMLILGLTVLVLSFTVIKLHLMLRFKR